MKVRWTTQAELDRLAIARFIAADNPFAAIRMDALFARAAKRLGRTPHMGRSAPISGSRQVIPHPHYRLIYEISNGEVWVLAIVHTARQWPPAST